VTWKDNSPQKETTERRTKMSKVLGIALVVAGALGSAAGAQAGTITSPGLRPPPDGQLICELVNVGGKDLEVRFEILELNSDVPILDSTLIIEPNRVNGFVTSDDDARWCRFTFRGSRRKVRASVFASDSAGGVTGALEAR
jgi:hypothetical protein